MSLSRNTLIGNLKAFVVSYFFISSYLTFAGEGPQIPSLKTGWKLGKNQIDYARERVANMSRQDREQLEHLQLQEILPSVIHQQMPWYVLKEVGFSISDDNLTRTQKYIRLAQITKFYEH